MPSLKHLFLLVTGSIVVSPLPAQSYPVASVSFSGDPSFSQTELLSASGAAVGGSLDQAGMQAAAARLNATGMFSNIRFSFNGKELHFELTPATNLAPVRFANFPWWQATEISSQMTAKVPLFHGKAAPGTGTEQEIVKSLTAMLAERQIAATVIAVPDVDLATGKVKALDFRITSPLVQIGAVTITGASGDFTAPLAEIQKAAAKVDYLTVDTPTTLTQAIESVYRQRGYLDGRVISLVPQAPVNDTETGTLIVRVPVTIAVEEGGQYRLGQFTVAGSVLMDQSEFLSKALLKPGDVVEEEKLKRTMQMLSAPYVTRGYIRAKISATPALNREKHTVEYAITVTPGDAYTMGKLEVRDLDPQLQTLVVKSWKLDAGAPYDATYVQQFLKRNKDLHALDGYSGSYKQYEHEDTHIVDLVVSFRKGGPLS